MATPDASSAAGEVCFLCLESDGPLTAYCQCSLHAHVACMREYLQRSVARSPISQIGCCVCKAKYSCEVCRVDVFLVFDRVMAAFYVGLLLIHPSLISLHVFSTTAHVHYLSAFVQAICVATHVATQNQYQKDTGSHRWIRIITQPTQMRVRCPNGDDVTVRVSAAQQRSIQRIRLGARVVSV